MALLSFGIFRTLGKREYLVIIRDNKFAEKHMLCSRRDGSDEASEHMVLMRNKKNYHQILPLN